MVRWRGNLEKIDDFRWRIPLSFKAGMRVPGVIYASQDMLEDIVEDQAPEQVANVSFLPGIVKYSLAMPDIHWGYGFPIGGVAATGGSDGVVSPGGVGFDINCGVRLLKTDLSYDEVYPKIKVLLDTLYKNIPSGLGSKGRISLLEGEIDEVLAEGAFWAVKNGYGKSEDLETSEENGRMTEADPKTVSRRAKDRGSPQIGTLGSGNHFLEVAAIDKIFDSGIARVMGIDRINQVMLLIHCGSRGLGHQVASDYLKEMTRAMFKYNIQVPDRQLACCPVSSPEGQAYLSAMRCAANFAWANRQCITHWVRESFCQALGVCEEEAGLEGVYDVAHNIAKIEEHSIDGRPQTLCVHRKGATRAFPPGHPELPAKYSRIGQPVLIPGDMGRVSYILTGTEKGMLDTFGSTCHGAGRAKSRSAAKRELKGKEVLLELESRGIIVRAGSIPELAEEASEAYKDVSRVVEVVQNSGISRIIARTRPLGVIKG
ncbi:MAG: RtcB family protein [Dehalococcoidales bacterium]|nr:RtcB family protein [Dehalococcoidales bacterium]